MQTFINIWKKWNVKTNITSPIEEEALQMSLAYLIILTTFIGIASVIFIEKSSVAIRIFVFEAIFILTFILLRLKKMSLFSLQVITVMGITVGISSFWFETKGLLGSFIFYFFIAITLSNTLLPIIYHKRIILINLFIIITFGLIDIAYFSTTNKLFASDYSQKIFNWVLVFLGTVVSSVIITYFKSSYQQAHQELADKNAQLEAANKQLDLLIYSISHDLRAPIASIMGLVELHKKIAETETAQKYIQLEEKALHNLDKFIEDLLAYSRVNRSEVQFEAVDLPHLLHEITQQYAYYHTKNVEILIKGSLTQPFFSDKTKLRIALQNLVGNAVNYADLSKEKPYCHLFVRENGKSVEIEIVDNGVGIEEKHGIKIFEMFYRANNIIKGSGLGLYMVKEAIEKVHGTIRFESKLGEGTRFFLTFPFKQM